MENQGNWKQKLKEKNQWNQKPVLLPKIKKVNRMHKSQSWQKINKKAKKKKM